MHRGLRITFRVNKQQETYADMTNRLPRYSKTGIIVIPIGIYCYFDLTLNSKVAKFRFVKHKASINAISIHFESL